MTIFDRIQKHAPEVGDVIEGRGQIVNDLLYWSTTGGFVYGVVVGISKTSMQIHTYSGIKEVHGAFTGRVVIDNSDIMRKGWARIWLVLPLARTARGHLVNLPETGIAVEVGLNERGH